MSAMRQTLTVLAVFALCFLYAHSEDSMGDNFKVNLNAGKQCVAKLDLPADYDRLKLPRNTSDGPLDMIVKMDIRQVREVDESKKSYTLDVVFYIQWRDETLAGQTEKTDCNPVFPHHVTPEFWTPGDRYSL